MSIRIIYNLRVIFLLTLISLLPLEAGAQVPVTITVTKTVAPTTATYSPAILKSGDNEGLWTPDDTGVVQDNLAAAQNSDFELRQFRTVGLQFVNGTNTMGVYQPFYTSGGQQILPLDYLAGFTYTDRVSANGNIGVSAAVLHSAPYPGQQANTVSGRSFSVSSNSVTWSVAAPTFTGTLNGNTSITNIPGSPNLYSGLLLLQAGIPTGTVIVSSAYNSGSNTTSLVISQAATLSGSVSIAYSAIIPQAVVLPSGFANAYLNGFLLTVSNVTATSITAAGGGFAHADVGVTSDTGILTAQAAFTFASPLANATAAGDVYTLEKLESQTPSSAWIVGNGNIYTTCSASQISGNVTTPLLGSQSITITGCHVAAVFDNGIQDGAVSVNRFVSLDGVYNGSVMARAENGTNGAFTLRLFRSAGGTLCTQNFVATSSPATYTFTSCTPSENSSTAVSGAAELDVAPISGGTITFDHLQLNKISGKSPNNTTNIRDDVIAAKQYGNGMSGKTVMPAGTTNVNSTLRDWLEDERSVQSLMLPQSSAPQTWSGTLGNENHLSNTPQIPDFMAEAKLVGAIPHFVIPCTARNDEAPIYSQIFFGTSTTTTGGALRLAAGSAQPYVGPTGLFPKIILEMCNEDWNTSFQGITVLPTRPGAYGLSDYARAAGTFFAAMRADPSFVASAALLMVNNQNGVSSAWTDTNAQAPLPVMKALGGAPDGFTTAGYTQAAYANFGTESDAWSAALAEGVISGREDAALQSLTCYGGVLCKVEVYEQNNSTGATCGMNNTPACDSSGHHKYVTQAAMQAVQAGAGSAFAATNQIKSETDAGYIGGNEFGMSAFANNPFINSADNSTQLYNSIFGESIDMGGACSYFNRGLFGGYFCPRPNLIGRHLYNKAIVGQVVTTTSTAATLNFAGDTANGPTPAQSNVPIVLSQGTMDSSGNMGLWLSNTSITTAYSVTFTGAGAPTGTCSTEILNPSSFNALNDSPAGTVETATASQVYSTTSTGSCPSSFTLNPREMVTFTYSTSAPPANPCAILINPKGSVLFGSGVLISCNN